MPRIETLYRDHLDLIYKRAHAFSATTGIPVSDFIGESSTVFMKAVKKWNPAKGKFNTHLWKCLNNGFIDFSKKWYSLMTGEDAEILVNQVTATEYDYTGINDIYAKAGTEAREVIDLLTRSVHESFVISGGESPKKMRGQIIRHLKELGWSWPKIWSTIRELKELTS